MAGGMGRMAGRAGPERPPPEQRRFTDRELLLRYLSLVKPYRWSLALVFLLYFGNAVLNLMPGVAAWLLIDIFVQHETVERFGISIDSASLFPDVQSSATGALYFAGVVVLLIVIANVIGVAMWRFGTRVSQHFLLDLKQRVHMHLHKLHVSYFERERTGSIMSRCVSDVEQMDQMVRQSFNLFYGSIHLIGVPFVMLVMSPLLFCFVLPPIPIIVFAVWRIRRRLRPLYRQLREQQAEVGAAIQEQISGIKEIKAFGQEGPAHRTYTRANIALVRTHLDAMRVFSVNHQLLYGNRDFANLLVALGGGLLVIYGLGNVTVGILIGFLPLLTRFFDPINQLVGFYDVIQRGLASTERVFEFLDIEPEVQDRPDAHWADLRRGAVRFEQVHFAYDQEQWVLQDVDVDIPAGTKVAVIGATGAGKTTLISLLLRFYQPQHGRILIDDHDIAELQYGALSRAFGIVFQETFLFYGSIAQNIAFSHTGATEADIREAARRAHIDDFIASLPAGYDTTVGERGVKLSGGQRQRLAIARMILKDPAIVILDEATSAVDNETERAIQASLDELLRDRTAFIIAHRLSTIQDADLLLCMEHGRLVEAGRPSELATRPGGVYQRLLAAGIAS